LLNQLDPASALAMGLLIFSLVMVIMFEATNGFHDAANAVATVIYTKSLHPGQAVVLSGIMNFVGVLVGGIAVAYALVELLPAEVLSPPDGGARRGDVGRTVCRGAVMEHRHLVVRIAEFELALPDRVAHWYRARQCIRPLPQHRRRRALGATMEST
jgi:hypothetical protein